MEVPKGWFGGPECFRWSESTEVEHGHHTAAEGAVNAPKPGCVTFSSRMFTTGILYFEHINVVANENHNITGGWKLPAFAFTAQVQTLLGTKWLQATVPTTSIGDERYTSRFPEYPVDTLMSMPTKYAYLLSNYMSHLTVLLQHCLTKNHSLNFVDFCVSNPDFCPCADVYVGYSVDFVFPVMV